MQDQTDVVHANFISRVRDENLPQPAAYSPPGEAVGAKLIEIFQSQVLSRQLDLESRRMQARGEGFYTIGCSGTPAPMSSPPILRRMRLRRWRCRIRC